MFTWHFTISSLKGRNQLAFNLNHLAKIYCKPINGKSLNW